MNNKADATIKKYSMLQSGDKVVVGFSGGADSSALLHFLSTNKDKYNIEVYACHINHNLRGEEAMRDQTFCEDFCKSLGVHLEIISLDVAKLSREASKSVELCARELRYKYFRDLSQKYSAKIATAHTLSDTTETIIWNLTRGTGTKGLLGIPPIRQEIIRPLIGCTRTEIENYCKENNILFVTDSTNLQNDYTRNKIRNIVVPVLKGLNSSVEASFERMSTILREENDFLDAYSLDAYNQSKKENGFDVNIISKQHIAIKKRIIYKIINDLGVDSSTKLVQLILNIIEEGSGAVEIADNKILQVNGEVLNLRETELIQSYFEKKLNFGKFTLFNGKSLEISLIDKKEYEKIINISKHYLKNSFDYDRILGDVLIRQKIDGDKISLSGRQGTKLIKKLFNEKSLSATQRSRSFVLCDEEGVIFLEGYGCDKRVEVNENSKNIVLLKTTDNIL